MNKVKESQVETVVDTLCNNMLDKSEQLRDISSIGTYKITFIDSVVLLCFNNKESQ